MCITGTLKWLAILTVFSFSWRCPGQAGTKNVRSTGLASNTEEAANFTAIKAKAEANDVEAKLVLGWMYDEGMGVLRSSRDASSWWWKAADQGLATAQLVQKSMLVYLSGSPASSGEGFTW